MGKYAIGIDFGTGSGRVLLVDVSNGSIKGSSICAYKNGVDEKKLFHKQLSKDFSLQNSIDYLAVLQTGIPEALHDADVSACDIVGIGIDFTASTMVVTDSNFIPLSWKKAHKHHPHAYVKLWKHHGAKDEADYIRQSAGVDVSKHLGTYGFNVSSEWIIPKILELKNKAPEILKVTAHIMEAGDWVVSKLTNTNIRSNCSRGYKSFWNEKDGFDYTFYEKIDKDLPAIIKEKLDGNLVKIGQRAGLLSHEMGERIGLPEGIPVAPFMIDAHASLLGVGSTKQDQLTMVMGTSTCHIMQHKEQKRIPGISGSVKDAIIPELYAYEAGQSAVGDLFEYAIKQVPEAYTVEAKRNHISVYDLLEHKATLTKPGESGLIALDWHNGNRSLLSDSNLSSVIVGQTLNTKPEDVYRAYMEATAFGTRMIIDSYEQYGLTIGEVFACGGLPKKNALLMQIYADILNKPVIISDSDYAPAIGAAILGALAGGVFDHIEEAIENMKQPLLKTVYPIDKNVEVYDTLFNTYRDIHDYFGIENKALMHELRCF